MAKATPKPYFELPGIRLLAHRGLSQHRDDIDENSLNAFEEALNFGATHLESDVHSTKDGVAVLFHDQNLKRVAGIDKALADIEFEQLQKISLRHGSYVPTLEQALIQFPDAKFNLDIKSAAAALPAAKVINDTNSHNRVLVSSFSHKRRDMTLAALTAEVATSAAVSNFLSIFASSKIGLLPLAKSISAKLDAVQIPVSEGPLRFATPGFIRFLTRLELEVHFWTINDPEQMVRLVDMGATGIVTDRIDLVPAKLRKA